MLEEMFTKVEKKKKALKMQTNISDAFEGLTVTREGKARRFFLSINNNLKLYGKNQIFYRISRR